MVALALIGHKWHRDGLVELVGTEAWTVELRGRLSVSAARPHVGDLRLREHDGGVEVGLLLLGMRGLGLLRLPGPRFDYGEALWRLGVELDGEPGWLGLRCDLDRAAVGVLGRALIRYPVRRASIEHEDDGERWTVSVDAGGATLRIEVVPGAADVDPVPARPLVVGRGHGSRYRVPWREDPAPWRRLAVVRVVEDELSELTLGDSVRWDAEAVVHRGRTHRCGVASRWRPRGPG